MAETWAYLKLNQMYVIGNFNMDLICLWENINDSRKLGGDGILTAGGGMDLRRRRTGGKGSELAGNSVCHLTGFYLLSFWVIQSTFTGELYGVGGCSGLSALGAAMRNTSSICCGQVRKVSGRTPTWADRLGRKQPCQVSA